MSSTILRKIRTKEKARYKLVSELLELKEIVRGSFCTIHVKCGTRGCRCQNGQLHPHQRMSWREKGRDLSRAVPKEDRAWVKRMTDQYRRFRQLRKEITKIEKEIKQLLDDYEKALVNKTRKGRLYLDIWNS